MIEVQWQPWREYERAVVIVPGRDHRTVNDRGVMVGSLNTDLWFLVLRGAADHAFALRLSADTVQGKALGQEHRRPMVWDVALHASWTTEEAGATSSQSCDYLEGGLCFIVRYSCADAGQTWAEAPADFDDLDMKPERLLALDGVWHKTAELYQQYLAVLLPEKRTVCPACYGKGVVKP